MTTTITTLGNADVWQQALYAFLAEKHKRSESRRTVEDYSRMLQDFFGRTRKLPREVDSKDIFAFAHVQDCPAAVPTRARYLRIGFHGAWT